ncbi:MAG: DEAD/DEAH box helicase [Candidatus Diapherotrites archaeon]|nr:DEAD/DEAH box helicase [Candidatus Diapherotrites archaeon]
MQKSLNKNEEIEKIVLKANSFESFNPLQEKVLKEDWANSCLVVSAPTASGKTIVAELCALNCLLKKNMKVVYTAPLKALAAEHYKDWKKKYSDLGIKVAISTGDFDSSSHYLSKYDWIVTTNEKLDSLITHRADWLSRVGLLIVDEIHEIGSTRGATIEAAIIKMLQLNEKLQIISLSATIPNADNIASWLNAKLILSDYRPVKLMEGVLLDEEIFFSKETIKLDTQDIEGLILDTLAQKKQILIFMLTRKKTEQMCEKIADIVDKKLFPREKLYLKNIAHKIENVLENPTEQCRNLAKLVSRGIAFHHAGLMPKQREIIEDAFREGKIKAIVATTTLAMGINLPAFRVFIPSLYRYTEFGMQKIPVSEYKQLAGRAGRPKYDSLGQAITLAKSEDEKEEIINNYIKGNPEPIESNLAYEPVLRTQVLSIIASNIANKPNSIESFFQKSFYFYQYGNTQALNKKVKSILQDLISYDFVFQDKERFIATPLGERVAELYLDPESAYRMMQHLTSNMTELKALYCIVEATEFGSYPKITNSKKESLFQEFLARENELRLDAMKTYFTDEFALEKFNASLLLSNWINEVSEQQIMDEFNVEPGVLHSKLMICDWLSYSAAELAKLMGLKENAFFMEKIRKRLQSGIREELIPLVQLRGIGRVRARKLYRNGIRSISDLKKAHASDIAKIIGEKVALNIKSQLGKLE